MVQEGIGFIEIKLSHVTTTIRLNNTHERALLYKAVWAV